jgi:hypothetical protein
MVARCCRTRSFLIPLHQNPAHSVRSKIFSRGIDPVLGDAYIPGYNRAFKVITRSPTSELTRTPKICRDCRVVYVHPIVANFLCYCGNAPLTSGALSQFNPLGPCCAELHTPKKWGAYVEGHEHWACAFTRPANFPIARYSTPAQPCNCHRYVPSRFSPQALRSTHSTFQNHNPTTRQFRWRP